MTKSSTLTAEALNPSRPLRFLARWITEGIRRMRDRAMTRSALAGLDDKHLRDIGMTAQDRDAVSGILASGIDKEDLILRARLRSGNW